MTADFYCDEVLSGKTQVNKVLETENILAYYHTKPFYPVHIVVIPKKHISSFITLEESDDHLLLELLKVVKQVATMVTEENGACRVITNVGEYQDSYYEMVKLLIQFKPDVLGKNKAGKSTLDFAMQVGDVKLINILR